MGNPKDLEQAMRGVAEKLATAFVDALSAELREVVPSSARGAASGSLNAAFRRIVRANSQTAILEILLEEASALSPRVAIFIAKGEKLAGWRGRGLPPDVDLARAFISPLPGSNWQQAIGQAPEGDAQMPAVAEGVAQLFFSVLHEPGDRLAYLLPVVVKERIVAVVYADSGDQHATADVHALELLANLTGTYLEAWASRPRVTEKAAAPAPARQEAPAEAVAASAAAAAATAAVAPPQPPEPVAPLQAPAPEAIDVPEPPPPPAVDVLPQCAAPASLSAPAGAPRPLTGPDLSNIPASDHDVHRKAFRFAKLLVDDLILYNKDRIEQGRAQRDVYAVLKEDIDKSRAAYEKKWGSTVAGKIDYFHHLLVARVALEDPAILGTDYPGPLV